MDLSFTPLQDELRAQARSFLDATEAPTWSQLAELGWTGASVAEEQGGAGLTFLEEAVLHEEAGRALLHAPLWSTSCILPFLDGADQAAVASGEASWALALGPLVPDLDTATNVAVVGGDTIWELEGFEREVLATNDASRPLGVVSGGEPGRALCSSEVLPALRSRSLTILALEAVGGAVVRRDLQLGEEAVEPLPVLQDDRRGGGIPIGGAGRAGAAAGAAGMGARVGGGRGGAEPPTPRRGRRARGGLARPGADVPAGPDRNSAKRRAAHGKSWLFCQRLSAAPSAL